MIHHSLILCLAWLGCSKPNDTCGEDFGRADDGNCYPLHAGCPLGTTMDEAGDCESLEAWLDTHADADADTDADADADADTDADADADGGSAWDCSGAGVCSDRTIGSGADMDSMASCASVAGNVIVYPFSSDIDDTEGMSCLTEVTGDLNFSDIDSLTNLDGLTALTMVGGDLKIWGNDSLLDISGLSSLTTVAGNVEIESNDVLCRSAVNAFVAGLIVSGSISISGNGDC